MAEVDTIERLRAAFAEPLGPCERRRVLLWHDPDGEFSEELAEIAEDPSLVACGDRTLRVVDVREIGSFEVKLLVNRGDTGDDLLVYADWPYDLSRRGLEDDWLADVELWCDHFQADWLSLLCSEMGAEGSARPGFENFKAFFGAKARRERFRRLVPHAASPADVALGVIACCLRAEGTSLPQISLALLRVTQGGGLPEELGKYGADAALASLLEARLGYQGPLDDASSIATSVAMSALSCTLTQSLPGALGGLVLSGHEEECLSLWRDWVAGAGEGEMLPLAREVEEVNGVPSALGGLGASELGESDVLPCTGELAVAEIMRSLSEGADRSQEAIGLVARRRDLSWYGEVAEFCDALDSAARMRSFQTRNAGGFHLASATEVWETYVSDWSSVDSDYRHLVSAADAAVRAHPEASDALRDSLDSLCDWAESLYQNWFLRGVNDCWVQSAEMQWADIGSVRGVPREGDFWEDVVSRELSGASRVVVVISDAMRYEVGAELADRLSSETKGAVRLQSMQAAFPSVTEFGMASLLPHTELELPDGAKAGPLADGARTDGIENRQAVLRKHEPSARAIRARDFIGARCQDRREMLGDAKVTYVYHNLIDSVGEGFPTEDKVLGACSDAVDELVSIVKILMNDLRVNRVVVTADHGFLYTRRPLPESQNVVLAEVTEAADVVFSDRRAAITRVAPEGDTLVRVRLGYKSSIPLFGSAPRQCVRIRQRGAGDRYVHGGVSLQELCVPVLSVRFSDNRLKSRVEQEPARLALLSTDRRVTSAVFRVELRQPAPVGGKVLAAEYELVLEDAAGSAVSDVRRASAASEDPDDRARVTKVQLALKPGVEYSPRDSYYLVCRDSSGAVAWREEFHVEVAIAPLDDFGF